MSATSTKTDMEPKAAENTPAPKKTGPTVNTLLSGNTPNPQMPGDSTDLLLTDPTKFVKVVTENVLQAVDQRDQNKEGIKQMWDDFYHKHPDLKDVDWHVQSVLKEKAKDWWDLPLSEAKENLAQEARKRIDLIKKKFGVKEEVLNSTNASTLPSSGEPAPRSDVPKKPTTFIEEMRSARKRRA